MPRTPIDPASSRVSQTARKTGQNEGWPPDDLIPASLDEARSMAAACTRCALYRNATQTVFGEGASNAAMMLVGEQPGDLEDLRGHVFVGPAGKVLDRALAEAGIHRTTLYVTNGVKHFKHEPRGKKRLHKRPDVREIDICRWWLKLEREFIKPRVVVAMGATAVRAVTGKSTSITSLRGRSNLLGEGAKLFATIHPSLILRLRGLPDGEDNADREYRRFVADLKAAAKAAT